MKKLTCNSDIGSVLVGTKDFQIALPNIGGDGITELLIFDDTGDFEKWWDANHTEKDISARHFIQSLKGKFNVFSDDCSNGRDEDVIATVEGRYGVYNDLFKVILVNWD